MLNNNNIVQVLFKGVKQQQHSVQVLIKGVKQQQHCSGAVQRCVFAARIAGSKPGRAFIK